MKRNLEIVPGSFLKERTIFSLFSSVPYHWKGGKNTPALLRTPFMEGGKGVSTFSWDLSEGVLSPRRAIIHKGFSSRIKELFER